MGPVGRCSIGSALGAHLGGNLGALGGGRAGMCGLRLLPLALAGALRSCGHWHS